MKAIVFSVFHKPYWIPSDSLYEPIQVGFNAQIINPNTSNPISRDNSGSNISSKNKNYCELTALYWIWKNFDLTQYDYIGLDHYRRHFSCRRTGSKQEQILTMDSFSRRFSDTNTQIILPRKRHYWIETNYTQYIHSHHKQDLEVTREAILKLHPEYLETYDSMMKKTCGHRFNMFIMRKDVLIDYCNWLFPILDYVEEHLDISDYSDYDARVFGFIAERIIDTWVVCNKLETAELPYVFMEKQNWIKKITAFLQRKLGIK